MAVAFKVLPASFALLAAVEKAIELFTEPEGFTDGWALLDAARKAAVALHKELIDARPGELGSLKNLDRVDLIRALVRGALYLPEGVPEPRAAVHEAMEQAQANAKALTELLEV